MKEKQKNWLHLNDKGACPKGRGERPIVEKVLMSLKFLSAVRKTSFSNNESLVKQHLCAVLRQILRLKTSHIPTTQATFLMKEHQVSSRLRGQETQGSTRF